MNKTFEQVSNAKHHFFIDEILLAGLINWIESNSVTLHDPKPFTILEVSGVDQIRPDPGFVYAFCISLRLLLYPSSIIFLSLHYICKFTSIFLFWHLGFKRTNQKENEESSCQSRYSSVFLHWFDLSVRYS